MNQIYLGDLYPTSYSGTRPGLIWSRLRGSLRSVTVRAVVVTVRVTPLGYINPILLTDIYRNVYF